MSNFDFLILYVTFTSSMYFSPGPNTTVVFATGMNYGFRATFPHCLATIVCSPLMLLSASFGLAELFHKYVLLRTLLLYCGSAYLLWLAWKVSGLGTSFKEKVLKAKSQITSEVIEAKDSNEATKSNKFTPNKKTANNLTFPQACVFQLVNPKAWLAHIYCVSKFLSDPNLFYFRLPLMCAAISLVALFSMVLWGAIGAYLANFVSTEGMRRCNYFFALLLAASVIMLFI